MKRIIPFALLLSLLAYCGCDSSPKTAPKRYGWDNMEHIPLYGDVYRVECVWGSFDGKTGQFTADRSCSCNYTYYFNKRGDVFKVIYHIIDFDIQHDIEGEYEYDSNGRLVKEPRIVGPLDDCYCEFIGTYHHQYDSNGRLVESVLKDSQGKTLYRKDEYKYDEKGHLIEEPLEDRSGENEEVFGTNKYKYDDNGNIIEKISSGTCFLHSGGALGFETTYKYKYNSEWFVVEEDTDPISGNSYSYVINRDRTIIYKIEKSDYWKGLHKTVEYRIKYRAKKAKG